MFEAIKLHVSEIGHNFKTCFGLLFRGKFSEAFKQIGYSGQEIFYWIGFGFALSEIINLALRDDITRRQKVLPMVGYGCVALFSLFAGLILFGAATTLIPFLVIIGAIVSLADSVGRYFAEKAERKAIIQQMSGKNIDKKLEAVKGGLGEQFKNMLQKDHFQREELSTLFSGIGIQFLSETQNAHATLSDPNEPMAKRKQVRKGLKTAFKETYGELLDFIALKQHLHFLNKSVKKRYINSFLLGGVVLITFFTAALPMMIYNLLIGTTPWIFGLMASISVAFWAVATINNVRLTLQNTLSQKKIAIPRKELEESLIPRIDKPNLVQSLEIGNNVDKMWSFLSNTSRKIAKWHLETRITSIALTPLEKLKGLFSSTQDTHVTYQPLQEESELLTPSPTVGWANGYSSSSSYPSSEEDSPSPARIRREMLRR